MLKYNYKDDKVVIITAVIKYLLATTADYCPGNGDAAADARETLADGDAEGSGGLRGHAVGAR
jgi:hypothetical protein